MFRKLKSLIFAFFLPIMPMSAGEISHPEPVVILGGGVGSLTSALYLGRAGLNPLVIEGPAPGGLLTQSHTVQNWPGVLEIDGVQLTDKMREQAKLSGARFVSEEVVEVDFKHHPFKIKTRTLDGSNETREIQTESCIIAMGTQPNFLEIPGEQLYWGRGVTNCAICDGSLYKDQIVGVVGGGDAAVLEALYLSNIAKKVYIFVRKGSLKAVEEKRVEILKQKPNVQFEYFTTVEKIQGDSDGVTGIVVKKNGKNQEFLLNGLFLAIGSKPNSQLFQKFLKMDEKGYILLEKDQQTSIKGVYAIGDIVDPIYKQAVSAAGDGAKAALQTQQYLSDREHQLAKKQEVKSKTKDFASLCKNQTVGSKNRDQKKSSSKEMIEVASVEQFQSELSSSKVPIVVDFYAAWCGPCKKISPMLEASADALSGKVKFLKVNVDKFFDLSTTYRIRAMPTVLLIDSSGTELDRKVGLDQITDLLHQLQKADEE